MTTPKPKKSKPKKVKEVQPYWTEIFVTFLTFMSAKFNEERIAVNGSAPRDLKLIVKELRTHAQGLKCEWNKVIACRTVLYFLEFAWNFNNPLLVIPHDKKWFLSLAAKYRVEIIESIRVYKLSKQKQIT